MGNCGRHRYGYKFNDVTGKYEIEPSEAIIVKHLYMYISIGYSVKESADIINAIGVRQTDGKKFDSLWIKRNLCNKRYIGDDNYPPIISNKIFNYCQKFFKDVTKSNSRTIRKAYVKLVRISDNECVDFVVLDSDLNKFI